MKYGHVDDVQGIDFLLPQDHPQNKAILQGVLPAKGLDLFVGCPVFSDRSYVGPVYPKGTRNADYLSAYAKQFNTIEVNSFRYGIPGYDKLARWKEAVDDGFRFSMKVQDRVTYQKDISGMTAREEMDRFLQVFDFFGQKAGMPFLLLPAYYRNERLEYLADFLLNLPNDFNIAVEFRENEGIESDLINDVLIRKQFPLVITDTPGRRDMLHMKLTSGTAFIRFAGAKLHPSDEERMNQWAERIAEWYKFGLHTVYFFVHQMAPYKYMAADNARQLISALDKLVPLKTVRTPIDFRLDP